METRRRMLKLVLRRKRAKFKRVEDEVEVEEECKLCKWWSKR